jgi:hypothetical protein
MSTPGFEFYQTYLAMKAHFKQDTGYDFFTMHGKVRASEESFLKRRDRWVIAGLEGRFDSRSSMIQFLAVNMCLDPNTYTSNLAAPSSMRNFEKYRQYEEKLPHSFINEIESIGLTYDQLVEHTARDHPMIFRKMLTKDISIWTFAIFDALTKLSVNSQIDDPVVWDTEIRKTKSFVKFMDVNWPRVEFCLDGWRLTH